MDQNQMQANNILYQSNHFIELHAHLKELQNFMVMNDLSIENNNRQDIASLCQELKLLSFTILQERNESHIKDVLYQEKVSRLEENMRNIEDFTITGVSRCLILHYFIRGHY